MEPRRAGPPRPVATRGRPLRDGCAIGVLVPPRAGSPEPPEASPVGRAALRLRDDGVEVVFGHEAASGRLTGLEARPGGWEAVRDAAIGAAYDRYPSQTDPDGFERLLSGLGGIPLFNDPTMTLLCRDKLRCQRALEAHGLTVPEVEEDPRAFRGRLEAWGAAFLKPRYGAFGRGVRRVVPGDPLPAVGEGAVPGRLEPLLLQRAVPPPPGWAGIACRVLVQRIGADAWHVERPIARRSRTDPVVNAARGAEVTLAEDTVPGTLEALRGLSLDVARALAAEDGGARLVEVGVDLVLDDQAVPWVVEVNGRPRGRLEAIADLRPDLREAHVEACARPLRWVAAAAALR